jgi:hypothetical protein
MIYYPSEWTDFDWMQRNVRDPTSHLDHPTLFPLDIAATDISNIVSRLSGTSYITQEVIWGLEDAVQPSEYVGIGEAIITP